MVQHPTLIRKRLIPLETLRLEKDVVISGAGRHVEVWNRDDFFRFIEET